jgi:hypothetical protein
MLIPPSGVYNRTDGAIRWPLGWELLIAEFEEKTVLWTIFVILLVLWLLGLITSYTVGGFIHVLLIVAVVVLVIRLVQGRRVI